MTCREAERLVMPYINGSITDDELRDFLEHIEHCGECREELEIYFTVDVGIRQLDEETPKETKYISNIDYFGEPIYTYSLREGIDDGFLAPFKVVNVQTDISEGWRPCFGQRDKFGNVIEDRIYTNSDFDYNIIIEDRTYEVAKEITEYLKQTDRMQKTIVFCANEDHAERMRVALNNLNADKVKENPDYVVRITGSDTYGKSKLDYFISVSSPYPDARMSRCLLRRKARQKQMMRAFAPMRPHSMP